MKYSSDCCQKCGRQIGWLGRFLESFSAKHTCTPRFAVGIKRQNIRLIYATAWNLEEASARYYEMKDILSINPKTEEYDMWNIE